jgi:hypothetical protein
MRWLYFRRVISVLQVNVDIGSSASPPARAAPKAKDLPSKNAAASSSDDDEVIVRPKAKPQAKAEVAGDDSDDALLSIICGSKNIESDDDVKPRAHAAATKAKPGCSPDDDARLHPALQSLPDDASKRAAKSSLPLTAAPAQKLQHVLVQCDEDCADLAGDSGVIGRFKYSEGRMLLDLKGYMYAKPFFQCVVMIC